jgi:hypothetical protein
VSKKRRWESLIIVFVAGTGFCGVLGHRPPGLPAERVAERAEWLDINLAPLRFRRVSEDPQAGPWKILISTEGHYCPVDDSTFVKVLNGERYPCEWRSQRP